MSDELSSEQVGAYLSTRLDGAEDVQVEKLSRNVGGMSRETWFATVRWRQDGRDRSGDFTFRLDHPEGSVVPVPLEYEYDVYRALADTDIPVAKALWYEDDHVWFGRPCYVRETIMGTSAPKTLFAEGEDELRAGIGHDLARLLARIHTLDWRTCGFPEFMPVPRDDRDCALLELDRWQRHFEANRAEPRPVITELYSWLRRHAPDEVARVSLVWGDVGLGNFIFENDRIVGLTDWEQAHLGDPMKDWASALYRGVDRLLPREELFAVYERESGIAIDDDRLEYYRVFIDAQYCSVSHPVVARFGVSSDIDITLARLSLGFPFYCQDDGLRTIGY